MTAPSNWGPRPVFTVVGLLPNNRLADVGRNEERDSGAKVQPWRSSSGEDDERGGKYEL